MAGGISQTQFEEWYQQYRRDVWVRCRALLGSEAADDAVQEVFLRKWHVRDRFDPERGSFKAWLLRNAHNHCISAWRRRKPEEPTAPEDLPEPEPGPDPAALTAANVTLDGALARLRPDDRQLVLLRFLDDSTWDEIAVATGCTYSQARTRTAQAAEKLARLLGEAGFVSEA